MEMTDRRSIVAASKSLTLPYSTAGEDANSGGSGWCNDESNLRNSSAGSINMNDNRTNGTSRIKKIHALLMMTTILSIYHLLSRGSSLLNPEDVSNVTKKNITEISDENNNIITDLQKESLPSTSQLLDETPNELAAQASITEVPKSRPISPSSDVDEPEIVNSVVEIDTGSGVGDGDDGVDSKSKSGSNDVADSPPSIPSIDDNIEKNDATVNIHEGKNITDYENNSTGGESIDGSEIAAKNITDYENNSTRGESIDGSEIASQSKSNTSEISISAPSDSQKTIQNSTSASNVSNRLPKLRTDSDLSPTAKNFVETHCDLSNLKDGAWYPSGPEFGWQQRAPYLIVAGVWNAGVNQLATALKKHPQINAAKQNGFFLPKQFYRFYDIQSTNINTKANNETRTASTGTNFNVKVFAARERMYAQAYSKTMFRDKISSNDEESTVITATTGDDNKNKDFESNDVAIDVSPGLIFYAHKTAHSILCTAPWVKIVVLLRNPIDRLYRQWSYSVTHLNLPLSLEDWLAQEMKLLQSVGMIKGGDAKTEPDKTTESMAWEKYQSARNVAGAIGRSLYVFQLDEWIQTFLSAGKTPSEEMIILKTEDIEENPESEYADLIQFLGLAPFNDFSTTNVVNSTDSAAIALGKSLMQKPETAPMTKETRNMLRQFFKPYNKRLTELLTSNGFKGNWHKDWD